MAKKGKRLVYVPEDLLEEVIEAARREGEHLNRLVEQALRLAVKFSRHVGGVKKLADLLEAVQTHRILGGSIVPLDVLNYLTCKAYRDEKEQVQAKWYESGRLYGKYLKEKFENPVEAFRKLLEATKWELSNVDVKNEGGQVKIRCISTQLTTEGTETLAKFIEGAMNSLEYETTQKEYMKGMIVLEFKLSP